jgi:hypothetical protein
MNGASPLRRRTFRTSGVCALVNGWGPEDKRGAARIRVMPDELLEKAGRRRCRNRIDCHGAQNTYGQQDERAQHGPE